MAGVGESAASASDTELELPGLQELHQLAELYAAIDPLTNQRGRCRHTCRGPQCSFRDTHRAINHFNHEMSLTRHPQGIPLASPCAVCRYVSAARRFLPFYLRDMRARTEVFAAVLAGLPPHFSRHLRVREADYIDLLPNRLPPSQSSSQGQLMSEIQSADVASARVARGKGTAGRVGGQRLLSLPFGVAQHSQPVALLSPNCFQRTTHMGTPRRVDLLGPC